MRKYILSLICVLLSTGIALADQKVTILENSISFKTLQLKDGKAIVSLDYQIEGANAKGTRTKLNVLYENTTYYSRTKAYKEGETIHYEFPIANARVWTPEYPNQYIAVISVWENNVEVCEKEVLFPIRTLEVGDKVCLLNGKKFPVNGVWFNQKETFETNNSKDALRFRLKWLRNIGCNVICCHDMVTAQTQSMCDKAGILVFHKEDPISMHWVKDFVATPLEYGYQPTSAYYQCLKQWKNKDAACLVATTPATHLEIVPDYVGNLTYAHIRLLAENNYLCTQAKNTILIEVVGDGKLVGIVSGSEVIRTTSNNIQHKASNGIITAVVEGNGSLSVRSKDVVGSMLQINHNN